MKCEKEVALDRIGWRPEPLGHEESGTIEGIGSASHAVTGRKGSIRKLTAAAFIAFYRNIRCATKPEPMNIEEEPQHKITRPPQRQNDDPGALRGSQLEKPHYDVAESDIVLRASFGPPRNWARRTDTASQEQAGSGSGTTQVVANRVLREWVVMAELKFGSVHALASKRLSITPYYFRAKAFGDWGVLLIDAPKEVPESWDDMKAMLLTRSTFKTESKTWAQVEDHLRRELESAHELGIWTGGPQGNSATGAIQAQKETRMGLAVIVAISGQGRNQGTDGMRQGHLDSVGGGHSTVDIRDLKFPSSAEVTLPLGAQRSASPAMMEGIWLRIAPAPRTRPAATATDAIDVGEYGTGPARALRR
ncbi:hypothetical protein Efla_004545 [Eimeria flavescens]